MAIIANNLATVPWTVHQRVGDKKLRASDHPAFNLLRNEPHPHYSSTNFRKALFGSALLTGNGYARIYRSATGSVEKLELIASSEVTPVKDRDDDLFYYISNSGIVIPHYDMIHIAALGWDGISGKSPITLARESIGIGIAATQTGATFWKNGAFLDGYVTFPGTLDAESSQRLTKSWNANYSGALNAAKTAFLEQGGEYKQLGMKMSDAQFIETRKFQIEDVARWFGVPLHKIGHLEKSSFNNIEQQAIEFVENCLRPWAVATEQEFNRKLFAFDKGEYFTKLELKGLLRGDIKTRTEFYSKMLDSGTFSINDIRELEDMDPVDHGDIRTQQINRIPIEYMEDYAKSITAKKGTET